MEKWHVTCTKINKADRPVSDLSVRVKAEGAVAISSCSLGLYAVPGTESIEKGNIRYQLVKEAHF